MNTCYRCFKGIIEVPSEIIDHCATYKHILIHYLSIYCMELLLEMSVCIKMLIINFLIKIPEFDWSCLHQRKHKRWPKSIFSGLKSIFAVVPQGFVLRLLLFVVYINDIAKHLLVLQLSLWGRESWLLYFNCLPCGC